MLTVTRTPLRISLFGGGTDYPEYFERAPGAVVGAAIDKYIIIAALDLIGCQDYNYRLSYSRVEHCNNISEIEHPVVREVLKHFNVTRRLDMSIISDLPAAGSGLGSSSAFTVGFLRTIYAILNQKPTKIELSKKAIEVEREILRENVGVQDQLHAAFGGINRFDFNGSAIRISPVQMSAAAIQQLNASMVLVHTGIARRATTTVAAQIAVTRARAIDKELSELYRLVEECVSLLEAGTSGWLTQLGEMLSASWRIKRTLSREVSNAVLDDLFEAITASGAYGAKLCGAGGGGFFLALIDPARLPALIERVAPLSVVPIGIDVDGSTLIYRQTR
ncbi:GHMP kinase [Methylobacterium sp. NMS14P]|uniref:GHMP family kinase ATP-binding protein n=1 Tax=Methylobacterium sp. NMS14P TaxID=2894310 RepID=UPI00235895BA|nr:GHMP kinase [Methylobacterium sp. NMS14P]WCS26464.1 GHMP kinase [Methylobacterium sp. NMS14P]